ncbi:MAG: M67 family peptidase [Gammaproteobacteria bacterium]|nr:MAG: M67 family peptidase [Gammaproteobacteria bacterium]
MERIALPRPVVNRLLAEAQAHPETEVCGLIGARDGHAVSVYPVANVASDPGRLFDMDPRGLVDAMRTLRERGETLFAIYHSHPHAPAEPSATDLRELAYPEAVYLIISLDTRGVLQMRAWRLRDGRPEEAELDLEEMLD